MKLKINNGKLKFENSVLNPKSKWWPTNKLKNGFVVNTIYLLYFIKTKNMDLICVIRFTSIN